MHVTALGVALGLIAVVVAALLITRPIEALERRLVRAARNLPPDTRLVRRNGVLVIEEPTR